MLWVSLSPGLWFPCPQGCAMPWSALTVTLCPSFQATCGGVLRGTGRQKLGALANAVGYYTLGFPIGISLMFAAKMGVLGTCALQLVWFELC